MATHLSYPHVTVAEVVKHDVKKIWISETQLYMSANVTINMLVIYLLR